jgi:hypothetical protein
MGSIARYYIHNCLSVDLDAISLDKDHGSNVCETSDHFPTETNMGKL